MKIAKFTLLFILVILPFFSLENKDVKSLETPAIRVKFASFQIAYQKLISHEGYYANVKFDRGGETYCGIPRLFNKDWIGWKEVDLYKKTHVLYNNDSIPGIIKWYVIDYYLNVWLENNLLYLKDQDIANYIFDTKVNLYFGGNIVKKTLIEMGYYTSLDNIIDRETITYINSVNKWEFLAKLSYNRMLVYSRIVQKHPNQSIFLNHWIYRSRLN